MEQWLLQKRITNRVFRCLLNQEYVFACFIPEKKHWQHREFEKNTTGPATSIKYSNMCECIRRPSSPLVRPCRSSHLPIRALSLEIIHQIDYFHLEILFALHFFHQQLTLLLLAMHLLLLVNKCFKQEFNEHKSTACAVCDSRIFAHEQTPDAMCFFVS